MILLVRGIRGLMILLVMGMLLILLLWGRVIILLRTIRRGRNRAVPADGGDMVGNLLPTHGGE